MNRANFERKVGFRYEKNLYLSFVYKVPTFEYVVIFFSVSTIEFE